MRNYFKAQDVFYILLATAFLLHAVQGKSIFRLEDIWIVIILISCWFFDRMLDRTLPESAGIILERIYFFFENFIQGSFRSVSLLSFLVYIDGGSIHTEADELTKLLFSVLNPWDSNGMPLAFTSYIWGMAISGFLSRDFKTIPHFAKRAVARELFQILLAGIIFVGLSSGSSSHSHRHGGKKQRKGWFQGLFKRSSKTEVFDFDGIDFEKNKRSRRDRKRDRTDRKADRKERKSEKKSRAEREMDNKYPGYKDR